MEDSSGRHGAHPYELRSRRVRVSCIQDLALSPSSERTEERKVVTKAVCVEGADYDKHTPAKAVCVEGGDYDDTDGLSPDRTGTEEGKLAYKRQCQRCVATALKFFNESKDAKKVGGYELVEIVGTTAFKSNLQGLWFHANFFAKPRKAPDDESKLFFAELNSAYPQPLKCNNCCLLEKYYGTNGCEACATFFPTLVHPEKGFRVGYPGYTLRGNIGGS